MSIKEQIQSDLKTAMLAGDKQKAGVLQGVKSAILYVEVETGKRETELDDNEVLRVLAKEAKKRQESIELYEQGGNSEQASQEKYEKEIIESYLPKQLSEEELTALIDATISKLGADSMKDMGRVITEVKNQAGAGADGATMARLVKERLS
jgi:uncharacterized protein